MRIQASTTVPLRISPDLIAAYEQTIYEVHAPGGIVLLKIGALLQASDSMLGSDVARVVVVTAFNPLSVPLSNARNMSRQAELLKTVELAKRRWLPARGCDPSGRWPPEASLAVLDPSDAEVDAWLRSFEQNAVVVAERRRPVALRFHPDAMQRPA